MVSSDEPVVEFVKYHYPRTVVDDEEVFASVARIPDAMLKKVDPTNPILVVYLQSINSSVETRVILTRTNEGCSKKSKKSKHASDAFPSNVVPKNITNKSPKKGSGDQEQFRRKLKSKSKI